jgi:ATP-dependent DNA helicase RecQ
MKRSDAEIILKKTFKLSKFHDEQWETIQKIFSGKKILLIEKTGFGKSLCYQFPATLLEGITVIFSPLLALMRDQVKKLNKLGISARCINSEQSQEENEQIIKDAKKGKIKILYIAPERQESAEWIDATQEMKLSMIVVDEAHCISVWGHDFRPAFKRIINLVKLLPEGMPVLATTATATKRVEEDIRQQIGKDLQVIRGSLVRDNFSLFVLKANSEEEKLIWLGENLPKLSGSGLIYTGTRVETEIYSNFLNHIGIPVANYNAGLDAASRIQIEDDLLANKWKAVVSTNALGMGIDKPDIRFVIHTQMPQSPIHYYQEIGRAGRDGNPSQIILLVNPDEDIKLPKSFIDSAKPSVEKYERVINALKSEMLGERELQKKTNLPQTPIRVIKADLMEQKIIRETSGKKYEYIRNAPPLDTKAFEVLRKDKLRELESMIGYINTKSSRMNFLCEYLGDEADDSFTNCDNTGLPKLQVKVTDTWTKQINDFREEYFPILKMESKDSNIIDGLAASYYGVSTVGEALHRSKYEKGGDYPDFLIRLTLKAIRQKIGKEKPDLLLYVPPTTSGNLVQNFAEKIATILKIPILHDLKKTRTTECQKIFQNSWSKKDNVKDAFTYTSPEKIKGKNILLIDDIFDSGATLKEIGKLLTKFGAVKIIPIVIARTVGGDQV